jgi:hypothetical protein
MKAWRYQTLRMIHYEAQSGDHAGSGRPTPETPAPYTQRRAGGGDMTAVQPCKRMPRPSMNVPPQIKPI